MDVSESPEPYKLLKSFTEHEDKVSYSRCKTILDGDRKSQINLDNRVPIYIVYLTAWVDSKGLLYYFDDIYNYDKHPEKSYSVKIINLSFIFFKF